LAIKITRQPPDGLTDADAAIATVLAELTDAGLVETSPGRDGAVHYALTDAGAPVARQMAMGSDQHAVALLGVLMGSIERQN
jgi:hypothetical protein